MISQTKKYLTIICGENEYISPFTSVESSQQVMTRKSRSQVISTCNSESQDESKKLESEFTLSSAESDITILNHGNIK